MQEDEPETFANRGYHHEAFFSRERFFRYTRNRDTAAGVTPGMREAWPRVSGRCAESFLRHFAGQAGYRQEIDVGGEAGIFIPFVAGNILFLAFDITVVLGLYLDLLGDRRRYIGALKTGQAGQVCVTDAGPAQELQQVDVLV